MNLLPGGEPVELFAYWCYMFKPFSIGGEVDSTIVDILELLLFSVRKSSYSPVTKIETDLYQ